MVPDEEPKPASDQSQARSAPRPRRSRRGGRRHSRGRGPHSISADATSNLAETTDATAVAEADSRPEREPRAEREPRSERPTEGAPAGSAISHAIDQVTRVIEELKRSVDEMEEVLETLELAERQKIDDEREIESLQRALRQLHRPAQGGGPPRH